MFVRIFSIVFLLLFFSCSPEDGKNGIDGIDGKINGVGVLIFTGDITNEEAAEIAAEDIGKDTHTVIISNTTNLSIINLSGISTLTKLEVINNEKLQSLNVLNLEYILDKGIIEGNESLTTITIENLREVRSFSIRENDKITNITFPKLETISGISFLQNALLENLNFPALKDISNRLFIGSNSNLSNLKIDNLETLGSLDIRKNEKLTVVNFPELLNSRGISIRDNGMIQSVSFSNLEAVSNDRIDIREDLLEIVNFEKLTTFSTLSINSTQLITSALFSSAQDFNRLQLNSAGRLSTETIDQVITALVSITPPITEAVILIHGTPSMQALTDIETLRTNGNTVTVTE